MAEYIKRKEAINAVRHAWAKGLEPTQYIEAIPAADVAEVVHGRWIVKGQDVFCSHCDEESGHNQWGASAFSNYCPNCGARMDGNSNA